MSVSYYRLKLTLNIQKLTIYYVRFSYWIITAYGDCRKVDAILGQDKRYLCKGGMRCENVKDARHLPDEQ